MQGLRKRVLFMSIAMCSHEGAAKKRSSCMVIGYWIGKMARQILWCVSID